YIVTIISNGLIVLNTGDSNNDGKRDIVDYNALTTPFTLVPPTSNTDKGKSDIPDQLFLFKGNQQVHNEIPIQALTSKAVNAITNQISQSFNSLDSSNLNQTSIDSQTQQLLNEFGELDQAVAGATITGRAFVDTNHNGIQDYGELGLAGIRVN